MIIMMQICRSILIKMLIKSKNTILRGTIYIHFLFMALR
uniref:Uncharacterized protein n=1 Tax=Amphimedon queenslandica TaxID=400682 RepID=A0A1X7VK19_AMPQE